MPDLLSADWEDAEVSVITTNDVVDPGSMTASELDALINLLIEPPENEKLVNNDATFTSSPPDEVLSISSAASSAEQLEEIAIHQSEATPSLPQEKLELREALAIRAKAGDAEAAHELTMEYDRLARYFASHTGRGMEFDEAYAVVMLGFATGLSTYSAENDWSIDTHMAQNMRWALLAAYRKGRKLDRVGLYDSIRNTDDGRPSDAILEDKRSPEGEEGVDLQDQAEAARTSIETQLQLVSENQRRAIRLKYGLEDGELHTQLEIAEIMGLKKRRVQQILALANETFTDVHRNNGVQRLSSVIRQISRDDEQKGAFLRGTLGQNRSGYFDSKQTLARKLSRRATTKLIPSFRAMTQPDLYSTAGLLPDGNAIERAQAVATYYSGRSDNRDNRALDISTKDELREIAQKMETGSLRTYVYHRYGLGDDDAKILQRREAIALSGEQEDEAQTQQRAVTELYRTALREGKDVNPTKRIYGALLETLQWNQSHAVKRIIARILDSQNLDKLEEAFNGLDDREQAIVLSSLSPVATANAKEKMAPAAERSHRRALPKVYEKLAANMDVGLFDNHILQRAHETRITKATIPDLTEDDSEIKLLEEAVENIVRSGRTKIVALTVDLLGLHGSRIGFREAQEAHGFSVTEAQTAFAEGMKMLDREMTAIQEKREAA